MTKKQKMKTPNWIIEGYDSEEDYNKSKGISKTKTSGKIFKIRKCPKCDSDDIAVVIGGEEAKGKWQCNKCGWKGIDVQKQELNENEMMEYLDEKGEEIA